MLRITITAWVVLLSFKGIFAQRQRMEIGIKYSFFKVSGEDGEIGERKVHMHGAGLELDYLFGPFIGVGAEFYEYPTFLGNSYHASEDDGFVLDTHGRSFGLTIHATTHRDRLFRGYAMVKAAFMQLRDEHEAGGFSIYNEGFVYSAGAGFALKMGRLFSWKVFEATFVMTSPELTYFDVEPMKGISVCSGIAMKFLNIK